jgi:lipopolysaccharide/colanic/teichoic acid biosynthesis glycosyltransferase
MRDPSAQPKCAAPLTSGIGAIGQTLFTLLALSSLVLLLPLLAGIACALWLESPGPVLIRRKRHGRTRSIHVYAFRTFDPGGATSPVGRWLRATGLDELPQVIALVTGELSVGELLAPGTAARASSVRLR